MMAKLKGSYASAQIRAGGQRKARYTRETHARSACQNAFAIARPSKAAVTIVPWLRHTSVRFQVRAGRLLNLGIPIDGPASAFNNSQKGIKRTTNPFEYVRRAASRNQDINQSHLIRRLSQSPTVVRPTFGTEDKSFFCRTGSTLSTRSEVQFVGVLQSKFAAGISDGDEEIQQRERRWTRFTIC